MSRRYVEHAVQVGIINHFRDSYDGVIAHVNNGANIGRNAAIRARAAGVVAGFPDLVIFSNGGVYMLEVKAPGGRISPAQKAFMNEVSDHVRSVQVVYSVEQARECFGAWGLPTKKAKVVREVGF